MLHTDQVTFHQFTQMPWVRRPLFALLGAAAGVLGCAQDPRNGDHPLEVQRDDCITCHLEDYEAATDPPHVQPFLHTECASCHDENQSFQEAPLFQHPWPLNGAHQVANCSGCHFQGAAETVEGWKFRGVAKECVSCHLNEYESATNPSHVELGLSTDCTACHVEDGFRPAPNYPHPWPLEGAHQLVSCAGCHQEEYTGTSTECVSCHLEDYESQPSHTANLYGTSCGVRCHKSTNSFSEFIRVTHPDASFPRTGFHALVCDDCHDASTGLNDGRANANCIGCHLSDGQVHSRTRMTETHSVVQSYAMVEDSTQNYCLTCHGDGNSPDHPQEIFPLEGTIHGAFACDSCHQVAPGEALLRDNAACVVCHDPDVERQRHDPPSLISDPPPSEDNFCLNCHPQGLAP